MEKIFKEDREHIKHALMGEVPVETDGQFWIYKPASKAECDEVILNAYDYAVYAFDKISEKLDKASLK